MGTKSKQNDFFMMLMRKKKKKQSHILSNKCGYNEFFIIGYLNMVYMDITWMSLVNVLNVSSRCMDIAWITMCAL